MKKTFLIAVLALLIAPCAQAQTPRVEANHSVSLDLLGPGLGYGYEHPVGRKSTIVGRAGVVGGLAWGSGFFGDYFGYAIVPAIGAEARYYHSLDRRAAKGRSTAGNSASFLSMGVRYLFPGGIASDGVEITGGTILTPGWGLRRVWRERWLFEFRTGVNLQLYSQLRSGSTDLYAFHIDWSPAANVRFGFVF